MVIFRGSCLTCGSYIEATIIIEFLGLGIECQRPLGTDMG